MLIDNGVVKVGLEIEVADWQGHKGYYNVASDLVDLGYMAEPKEQWKQHHTYHCSCSAGGCSHVRQGDIIVPPLVSMTYDASLPQCGAEFIVSPILMADKGMGPLKEIWDTVVDEAIWSDEYEDYHENEGASSPSIHIHVSASVDGPENMHPNYGSTTQDVLHALSLFTPELFAIADLASVRRALTFRLPTRAAIYNDDQGTHHGFIHVRKAVPEKYMYIEWRLFEAAYTDWQYVETCAYLAAVVTRALLKPDTKNVLMAQGYRSPYNEDRMTEAIYQQEDDFLFESVDGQRLDVLRQLCLENIHDDQYGYELLTQAFERVRDGVL